MSSNVPQLRFPEFEEEWEEKKLGEVFIEVNEKVGQRNLETYSITAGQGFVSQKEKFGRDISGQQNAKYTALQVNQFAYNKGNSKKYKYGCVYLNTTDKQIAVPNVFISFKLIDNEMSSVFYAKLFENHYLDKGLRQIISSSARMDGLLNVNKKYFFQLKIIVPTTPEQHKIAIFLTSVDEKLQALKKKKELLEQYKKGAMQKLFSQELRFKQDDGSAFPDWEEKKLGDIFDIKAGGDIDKSKVSDIKTGLYRYPIYSNSEKEKGLFGYSNSYSISEKCLTVTGRGRLGIAHARFENFYPIVRLLVLIPKIPANVVFYENIINQLNFAIESTGVPQLTSPQISSYKVHYPSFTEQEKIADFLSSIDGSIENVGKQIEASQEWKKGLLQKMFV
ncbi:restriction endonuclease subunit S [Methanococcoides burtonii]|uniref:Restriction modification system DNA specificity subunit n=1 Tax=Methanococcoides burtonii (strain DSM 6242 / NBRC 107633 / OCM 468 / ACE-M) TaxID=259564 RepID=Q12V01_METBU|nr:restriction endonuclease subunit S [Methanococcoides burtonii]ABE52725.1 Restriction modification system DNA specificity subunit [Methanococcoides burtonii DSM 6242]